MGGFKPPAWASQPCREATLEVHRPGGGVDRQPIDAQPWYTLGREAGAVDIVLDGGLPSRVHAALVHHSDGRLFLIDLESTHGTTVDGQPVPANKPVVMKDGAVLAFGAVKGAPAPPPLYKVRVESAAEKRRGDGAEQQQQEARKRPEASGGAPVSVRASHLLVKHCKSRNPSSWKEKEVTRSPEEALQMIQAFHAQLTSGDPSPEELASRFSELASVESHCSSARRGGDLGQFGRGQMQRAFEEGAFALGVGELSGPVSSDSGIHLILRTA